MTTANTDAVGDNHPAEAPFSLSERSRRMAANAIRELLEIVGKPGITSFAGGLPDPNLFPVEAVASASRKVLDRDPRNVLQYGVTIGLLELRERLVRHMWDRFSVPCSTDNIIVTSGSQQALDLAVRVLHNAGDGIVVDNPTYLGALQTFVASDAHLVANSSVDIELDTEGRRLSLDYVIPDFANPTGCRLTVEERVARLDRAARGRYALIEDAAYSELIYDGNPLPSMLELDCRKNGSIEATRTLYCGTFSKTLVPGLRVGWACGASAVIARLSRMKECVDILSPPLTQQIVAQLLGSGYDEHVAKLRAVYGRRKEIMMEALHDHLPDEVSWTRPMGGMFTWLTLPEHVDAEGLLQRAIAEAGIAYVPGNHFMPIEPAKNALRLSYCLHDEHVLRDGVRRLSRFLDEAMRCQE